MRVEWLRKALRNLDEEAAYIAMDDCRRPTRRWRVLDAAARSSEQPGLGPRGACRGLAELVVPRTRHLVPYRVHGRTVQILRVFAAVAAALAVSAADAEVPDTIAPRVLRKR
jgi:plasmid stabilization system protein ParE